MAVREPMVKAPAPSKQKYNSERPVRRFTLDEYHWLFEHSFFKPEDRVELLDGYLIEMSPIHPPHAYSVGQLYQLLVYALGKQAVVRSQQPITLEEQQSEPEPDLVVAVPPARRYVSRHPGPADILLVCEVSDATLASDRSTKLRLYAEAGIREYWIVNLVDGVLEIYLNPTRSAKRVTYASRLKISPGQPVSPLAFPNCLVEVGQILPEQGND